MLECDCFSYVEMWAILPLWHIKQFRGHAGIKCCGARIRRHTVSPLTPKVISCEPRLTVNSIRSGRFVIMEKAWRLSPFIMCPVTRIVCVFASNGALQFTDR